MTKDEYRVGDGLWQMPVWLRTAELVVLLVLLLNPKGVNGAIDPQFSANEGEFRWCEVPNGIPAKQKPGSPQHHRARTRCFLYGFSGGNARGLMLQPVSLYF